MWLFFIVFKMHNLVYENGQNMGLDTKGLESESYKVCKEGCTTRKSKGRKVVPWNGSWQETANSVYCFLIVFRMHILDDEISQKSIQMH